MNEGILFLTVSIVLDVIANLFLKKSDGFKNKSWGFGAVLLIIIAFIALSQAVKTMELSIAYALWGASGLLLTTGLDVVFYGVKLKSAGVVGLVCMVTGIVLLKSVS
ncbi:SMR family transporter [Anaerosinus massiliensis]|uniref:SMR family transporter n=1 Tax=Massilibacillus massiliensis TaxID=1806837 RepID=UPI000A8B7BC5|nr:SMR family transporter [Massilibacillus massiliensis]